MKLRHSSRVPPLQTLVEYHRGLFLCRDTITIAETGQKVVSTSDLEQTVPAPCLLSLTGPTFGGPVWGSHCGPQFWPACINSTCDVLEKRVPFWGRITDGLLTL